MAIKVLFLITALLICALHVLSVVIKKKIRDIFVYANLALHIALTFELMAMKTSFEFFALCFMISLLVYLFSFTVSVKIRERGGRDR